eukprot:3952972-Lingulodinium_polyedra.AAC.1
MANGQKGERADKDTTAYAFITRVATPMLHDRPQTRLSGHDCQTWRKSYAKRNRCEERGYPCPILDYCMVARDWATSRARQITVRRHRGK